MSYTLSASIWQEGEQFVSLCPELGVSSFGGTPQEALTMLHEAVDLYLETARDLGILDEITVTASSPLRFHSTFQVDVA